MLILVLVRNAGWPLMLWFIHHRIRREHLMLLRATQKCLGRLWIHITVASQFFRNSIIKVINIWSFRMHRQIFVWRQIMHRRVIVWCRQETEHERKSTTTEAHNPKKKNSVVVFSTSAFVQSPQHNFRSIFYFLKVRFISLEIQLHPLLNHPSMWLTSFIRRPSSPARSRCFYQSPFSNLVEGNLVLPAHRAQHWHLMLHDWRQSPGDSAQFIHGALSHSH